LVAVILHADFRLSHFRSWLSFLFFSPAHLLVLAVILYIHSFCALRFGKILREGWGSATSQTRCRVVSIYGCSCNRGRGSSILLSGSVACEEEEWEGWRMANSDRTPGGRREKKTTRLRLTSYHQPSVCETQNPSSASTKIAESRHRSTVVFSG